MATQPTRTRGIVRNLRIAAAITSAVHAKYGGKYEGNSGYMLKLADRIEHSGHIDDDDLITSYRDAAAQAGRGLFGADKRCLHGTLDAVASSLAWSQQIARSTPNSSFHARQANTSLAITIATAALDGVDLEPHLAPELKLGHEQWQEFIRLVAYSNTTTVSIAYTAASLRVPEQDRQVFEALVRSDGFDPEDALEMAALTR